MWVYVSFSLSVLCYHNKGCGQVSPQNNSRSFSLYNKPILAYIYIRIYVYNKRNNDLNESLLIKFWHTVYGVIFGLLCEGFLPVLYLLEESYVDREIIWIIGIRPGINTPAGVKGMSENKTGTNKANTKYSPVFHLLRYTCMWICFDKYWDA